MLPVAPTQPLEVRRRYHQRCLDLDWNYDRETGTARIRNLHAHVLLCQEALLDESLREIYLSWYRHVWKQHPEPTSP